MNFPDDQLMDHKPDAVAMCGLPSDTEAEGYILANLIHRGADFQQLSALIGAHDFTTEKNRRIWLAIEALVKAGDDISVLTVYRECEKRNPESGVMLWELRELDEVPRIVNLETYCQIVKNHSINRQVIVLTEKVSNHAALGTETSAELLDTLRAGVEALDRERTQQVTLLSLGDILESEGGLNEITRKRQIGIPYPWRTLTWLTAGMNPGQLILLAARPGVGKSAAALQIAVHAAQKGYHGAFFSLEMGKRELLIRALCGAAKVDSTVLRGGQLGQQERMELSAVASELARLPLRIDDTTGVTIPAMRAAMTKHKQRNRLDFVILDYLQLCDTVGRVENRVQAISQISRALKLLAREFEIPILALSQLSRLSAHEKREPELTDLRDGGSLEQDADTVMFLYAAEDVERPDKDPIPTKLLIKKQRAGARAKVDLIFSPMWCQFQELSNEREAA